mmetsp:Transcript_17637/g.57749  ORF Transcript_17637/g.57749 Transcript_17637/m.57749 type:complete len:282 (-) Transcript_17637:1040-1885(-)|eukprot:scaffold5036_cov117-Isochrysis_galbana.AAC.11
MSAEDESEGIIALDLGSKAVHEHTECTGRRSSTAITWPRGHGPGSCSAVISGRVTPWLRLVVHTGGAAAQLSRRVTLRVRWVRIRLGRAAAADALLGGHWGWRAYAGDLGRTAVAERGGAVRGHVEREVVCAAAHADVIVAALTRDQNGARWDGCVCRRHHPAGRLVALPHVCQDGGQLSGRDGLLQLAVKHLPRDGLGQQHLLDRIARQQDHADGRQLGALLRLPDSHRELDAAHAVHLGIDDDQVELGWAGGALEEHGERFGPGGSAARLGNPQLAQRG